MAACPYNDLTEQNNNDEEEDKDNKDKEEEEDNVPIMTSQSKTTAQKFLKPFYCAKKKS